MALCSRRPARRTVRSDMHRLDILSIGPGAGESATERMVGACRCSGADMTRPPRARQRQCARVPPDGEARTF